MLAERAEGLVVGSGQIFIRTPLGPGAPACTIPTTFAVLLLKGRNFRIGQKL